MLSECLRENVVWEEDLKSVYVEPSVFNFFICIACITLAVLTIQINSWRSIRLVNLFSMFLF